MRPDRRAPASPTRMAVALVGCVALLSGALSASGASAAAHADDDAVAPANKRVGSSDEARFKAVWNCPYLETAVVDKFGITANPSGSFNGSEMVLFYGPNTWPSLAATQNQNPCWTGKKPCTWNQSLIWANVTVSTNGGVPQAGNIELHTAAVAAMVEEMIPDPNWSGYGIFDWEEWRALYSENDDSLSYHNYYSMLLVRKQHPDWTNETQIEEEAEKQYVSIRKALFSRHSSRSHLVIIDWRAGTTPASSCSLLRPCAPPRSCGRKESLAITSTRWPRRRS